MNVSTDRLASILATHAGRIALGRVAVGTHAAYSGRSVVSQVAAEIGRRVNAIEGHASPTEAPGRGDLPALLVLATEADVVLALYSPLCPPV